MHESLCMNLDVCMYVCMHERIYECKYVFMYV